MTKIITNYLGKDWKNNDKKDIIKRLMIEALYQ